MSFFFDDSRDVEGLYVDTLAASYYVCWAIQDSDTLTVEHYSLTTHEKISAFCAKGRVLLGKSGGFARALVSVTKGAPAISLDTKVVDACWTQRDGGWQKGSFVAAPGGRGKWVRHE